MNSVNVPKRRRTQADRLLEERERTLNEIERYVRACARANNDQIWINGRRPPQIDITDAVLHLIDRMRKKKGDRT